MDATEHNSVQGMVIGGKFIKGPGQTFLGYTNLGKTGASGIVIWNGCPTLVTEGEMSPPVSGAVAWTTTVQVLVVTVTVGT